MTSEGAQSPRGDAFASWLALASFSALMTFVLAQQWAAACWSWFLAELLIRTSSSACRSCSSARRIHCGGAAKVPAIVPADSPLTAGFSADRTRDVASPFSKALWISLQTGQIERVKQCRLKQRSSTTWRPVARSMLVGEATKSVRCKRFSSRPSTELAPSSPGWPGIPLL